LNISCVQQSRLASISPVDIDALPFAWIEDVPDLKDDQGFPRLMEAVKSATQRVTKITFTLVREIKALAQRGTPANQLKSQSFSQFLSKKSSL
jgi:hypothetical protein